MIPDISDKINAYLKKNNFTPLFPYNPHQKTMFRKDFVVSWTHNYTTIVTRENKEYFFKVALEKQKFEDIKRQIDFYQLLGEQKNLTFKTPKLYEWNTSGDFYFYLREKMNGELLGNCVRAKQAFATKRIFSQLQKGFSEINEIPLPHHLGLSTSRQMGSEPDPHFREDDKLWEKTKDADWIMHKIKRTDENDILKSVMGYELWEKIKKNTPATHNQQLVFKPLWGDPGPNNFLVDDGYLAIIDYSPYTYGYDGADLAEFASFCIFTPEWEQFITTIMQNNNIKIEQFNAFFSVFLIDRMASVLWLEKRGQLKIQLKKPKEFYVEKIKNKLKEVLSASRRIEP